MPFPLLPLAVPLLLSLEADGAELGTGAIRLSQGSRAYPVAADRQAPSAPRSPRVAHRGGLTPAGGEMLGPPEAPKTKPVVEPASPSQRFDEGKVAFARGQYKRAMELLRPLIRPEVLLESESDLVAAHRMLGVALLFENQPGAAREEFRQLLELRPESRFDPLLDPPFIVDFFNGVLHEQQAEIKRLEQLRERSGKGGPPGAGGRPLIAVRNPAFVSFIPFGAGQFQNGERGKGWAFFAAESGLAALSVGAFVTNFALFGFHPRRGCTVAATSPMAPPSGCPPEAVDHSDEDLSRNLTRLQVGSGILFFATAIWGVVDAVRGYRDISFRPEPSPKPGETSRDPTAAPSVSFGFSVTGPSAAGLSFRF